MRIEEYQDCHYGLYWQKHDLITNFLQDDFQELYKTRPQDSLRLLLVKAALWFHNHVLLQAALA